MFLALRSHRLLWTLELLNTQRMSHCPTVAASGSLYRLALGCPTDHSLHFALSLLLKLELSLAHTHSHSSTALPMSQWCTKHRIVGGLLVSCLLYSPHKLGILRLNGFCGNVDQRVGYWAGVVLCRNRARKVLRVLKDSGYATYPVDSLHLLLLLVNRGTKDSPWSHLEGLKAIALRQQHMLRHWATKAVAWIACAATGIFGLVILLSETRLDIESAWTTRSVSWWGHLWITIGCSLMNIVLYYLPLLVTEEISPTSTDATIRRVLLLGLICRIYTSLLPALVSCVSQTDSHGEGRSLLSRWDYFGQWC